MAEAFRDRLLAALSALKPSTNTAPVSNPVATVPAPTFVPPVVPPNVSLPPQLPLFSLMNPNSTPVLRKAKVLKMNEDLLRWGLLLAGVGLGLALATLFFHWRDRHPPEKKPTSRQ